MSRLCGRAPRGDRCRAALPHGHWKTTTLVAGLRLDGLTAPMVINGAMNGKVFTDISQLTFKSMAIVSTLHRHGNSLPFPALR